MSSTYDSRSTEHHIFEDCERCNNRPATMNCSICLSKLCYDCDTQTHLLAHKKLHKRSIISYLSKEGGSLIGKRGEDELREEKISNLSPNLVGKSSREEDVLQTFGRGVTYDSATSPKERQNTLTYGLRVNNSYNNNINNMNNMGDRRYTMGTESETIGVIQSPEPSWKVTSTTRTKRLQIEKEQREREREIELLGPEQYARMHNLPIPGELHASPGRVQVREQVIVQDLMPNGRGGQAPNTGPSSGFLGSLENTLRSPRQILGYGGKETYYQSAQKYLEKEIEKGKAAYELDELLQRQKDDYQRRLDTMEKNYDSIRDNLMEEINELKRHITTDKRRHDDEIQHVTIENSSRFREMVREKDELISDLQDKVGSLKEQMGMEINKLGATRDELLDMKLIHNREVGELKSKLRISERSNDELISDHAVELKEGIDRYEDDKRIIKADYEGLIDEIRGEYEEKKTKFMCIIEEKDRDITDYRKEIQEMRNAYLIKTETLTKEIVVIQDNLKSTKRLNELMVAEKNSLINKLQDSKKEAKLLKNEVRLVEGENRRLFDENEGIKKRVAKMDKIVYGKVKSPATRKHK